jgi:hypothetical protein
VMAPERRAFKPYCTPTLSRVHRARLEPGTRPQIDSAQLQDRTGRRWDCAGVIDERRWESGNCSLLSVLA